MKLARQYVWFMSFCLAVIFAPQLFSQAAFDRQDFSTGATPVASIAYDFNQDGNTDLAAVNSGSNTVSIFLGSGDGQFTLLDNIAVGMNPSAMGIGDFNRDGVADLAVMNQGDSTISILLGNGDGTFTSAASVPLPGNSVVVKDFNRDGADDLATVSGNTISVVLGNGDGTFGAVSTYSGGPFSNSSSITSGDFNGDGIPDLAVENCCDPVIYFASVGRYVVLLGNGDGTFATPNLFGADGPVSLAAIDINNAGLDDLVSSYGGCHTPCVGVSVFLSNGDGTFRYGFDVPFTYTAHGSRLSALGLGDINNHGSPDIAAALFLDNAIALFPQKTDGSGFLHDIDFAVGQGPSSITMADFNNDGRTDMAITNSRSNSFTILLNADHAVVFLAEGGDYPLNYPVRFPDQRVGTTSSPQTVTLTNTGNIPLLISGIDIAGDYSQRNDCGSSVGVAASCTFSILFAPTVTGKRDGSITVTDNATNSPQVIGLTGNGIP